MLRHRISEIRIICNQHFKYTYKQKPFVVLIVIFVESKVDMGVQKLREELHEYINHADERFLKMVFAMSREYKESDVAGYNVDGSPITKESLKRRANAASLRVKSGDFLTQDEVEEEIKNW